MAFSPDSFLIATGTIGRAAKIWDTSSGSLIKILEGHTDDVNSIAFSPDSTQLVTGSSDNTAIIWDLSLKNVIQKLDG